MYFNWKIRLYQKLEFLVLTDLETLNRKTYKKTTILDVTLARLGQKSELDYMKVTFFDSWISPFTRRSGHDLHFYGDFMKQTESFTIRIMYSWRL